jgi:NAD(P)H dehydrogenase (quinone)
MTDYKTSKILVTGAGGHLGRRVVELLLEGGATNVVAGSRDPGKLAFDGVETRKVDFADIATLDAAFADIDQLLIVSTDVIGELRQKLQVAAVEAAGRAGVKHIVYTSLTNPGPDSAVTLAPDHHLTETAIEATGASATFLRNAVYMDMLLQALPPALASGQWYTAQGQGKIARITREDCARAAAAALLAGPQGKKRIVEVAGSELLTAEETAAIVSDVTGKPITVVHLDDDALAAGMVGAGLPPEIARLLVSFETATRLGQSEVKSQFAELVGTQPTSLRDYLTANRSALVV